VPLITALRARGGDRLAIELDGMPWRIVPAEAALRAGLDVGRELEREHARRLRRELRRLQALRTATRALRTCDLSARRVADRLERAGTTARVREETLGLLARSGLVDDLRLARDRAARLSDRGYGNAAIDADLARQGIAPDLREEALAALAPELERVCPILLRRGHGPRTARYLAARGFGEDAVAAAADAGFANDP
jgi:SOS response regulatory protein OraA/RecX